MREVQKGNKIPYHGYLMNMGEYETYQKMQELLPELIRYYEESQQNYRRK